MPYGNVQPHSSSDFWSDVQAQAAGWGFGNTGANQYISIPFGAQQTGAWWNQPLTYASGVGAVPATPMPTTGATGTIPAGSTMPTAGGFNLNPAPHAGAGTYGLVPGPLGLPNPAGDLGAQIPGLQGLNAKASGAISDFLGGGLSPAELSAIQDAGAIFGVRSGMPGSGLQMSGVMEEARRRAHERQKEGLAAYGPFVGAVSGTQTVSPALQAQIAEQNAINAAAPDPTAAQSHAEELYNRYLNSLSRSGGGGQAQPYRGGGGSQPSALRYSGSGYGGGYSPSQTQFNVAPALSYGANDYSPFNQNTTYNDYLDFLGVPSSQLPLYNDYSPFDSGTSYGDYLDYFGVSPDQIAPSYSDIPASGGLTEEDYYNWFGG